MDSGLVTMGAHSYSHADLCGLSKSEVEEELNASDELIEARIGLRPRHLAYPWGYWATLADGPVRRRYDFAVLVGSPRFRPSPDPHRLHRYPFQLSDGFPFFGARLAGGFRLEERLLRALKGYSGP